MKNLSDAEIIESIVRGNPNDFAILVDRYKNRAFSLLKRMLKNEMDAEEVLQDCFVKAFKSLTSFKQQSKFSTWFYRIVYNTALTKLAGKKRKIQNEMASVEDIIELKDESDIFSVEKKDISVYLSGLVQQLPSNYASVISLFYLDEMSCEEISEVMSVSESNVKVMLHRSRNALRDLIIKNNIVKEII